MPLDAQDKTTLEMLQHKYTYHAPQGDQPQRYQKIREQAFELAKLLIENCPSSPERSTALTQLDAVVFFANASIARYQG